MEMWYLEYDGVLFPLDRVYRVGKGTRIRIPPFDNKSLNVDLREIDSTIRLEAGEDNQAVIYPASDGVPPIVKPFYSNIVFGAGNETFSELPLDKLGFINFSDGNLRFEVLKDELIANRFRKAILVGAPGLRDPLKGVENDIHAMRGMLLRKEFPRWNIKEFLYRKATKKEVLNGLEEIVANSNSADTTLFYFTGHAKDDHIDLYDWHLEQNEFYAIFNQIKGQQIIIIDACDAENFVQGRNRYSCFLGASSANQNARETLTLPMGLFTRTLVNIVNSRSQINLADLDERVFDEKIKALSQYEDSQNVVFKRPPLYL